MSTAQSNLDLSVVIVSWNTRALLLRCIQSVFDEQIRSGLELEIIVVDNASSDGSAEAVARAFPNVVLLAQSENSGFAVANNRGIERSRGTAILILNPDAELRPGALSTLWKTLRASPHIGLVAPVLLNIDGTLQSAGYRFPGLIQTTLDLFPLHPRLINSEINGRFRPGDGLTPFRIDHPLGACMLVRRDVVDDVGMFDPGYFIYSEEIDWCRRIDAAGWTILCAPSARVTHHGAQSTEQAPDQMRRQLHQSRARYLRRYHSPVFHSALQMLIAGGIALMRAGLPIPDGGRTPDELAEIAGIYRDATSEASHG